ncbi:MAG: nad2 [Haloplasmataceae bacterium]|nr:nad2 [Haloplasmataceae bacterium]
MNYSLSYILLIPEIYFFFSLIFYLFYTSILNLSIYYKFPNYFKNNLYFFILILFNISLLILNYINISEYTISNYFYKDTFISLLQLFSIFFSMLLVLIGYSYVKSNNINHFELLILFLFGIFSLCLLTTSSHMTSLYLLLELQGITFYILTSFNRRNQYSLESGLKYFILGSFSSILLLFGISLLYGFTGLLSFSDIYIYLKNIDIYISNFNFNLIAVAFVFILISFLFKFYAAPFHLWIADIYQGAPTIVTAFFSVIPFFSVYYLFLKLLLIVFVKLYIIYNIIIKVAIVSSLVIGTLGALYQKKIKRLLAYSSITGIGYFLLLFLSESPIMLYNTFSYVLLYSFSLLSLFSIFLQLFLIKDKKYIEQLSLLSGYININKYASIVFLIFFFSIAGIPPFSLFIGKLFLLTNLALNKNYFFVFLVIIITILSCYYYLKVIKIIFFNNTNKWLFVSNFNFISSFFLVIFSVLHFYFFLSPSILNVFTKYLLFSIL